jgi:hypothetical protein
MGSNLCTSFKQKLVYTLRDYYISDFLIFGAFSFGDFTPVSSLVNCGCSSFLL